MISYFLSGCAGWMLLTAAGNSACGAAFTCSTVKTNRSGCQKWTLRLPSSTAIIALLETFAPAVRILAGEILLQVVPAAFGQVSIHHNGGATAQFTAVLLDRDLDAFHMSGQVGFILAVEILFQVVALPLDLLGDGCCVGGQFMTT